MENKKKRISIKLIILIPVFILGVVAIFSNARAIQNIRQVNDTAVKISEGSLVQISELSAIQKETQVIHQMGLSHIIAIDFETMVSLVENIRAEEAVLEGYFE